MDENRQEDHKSIINEIKSSYDEMSTIDRAISDYLLANPSYAAHASISDIAKELQVADSTIYKYARRLGYSGFKDLKIALLTSDNDNNPYLFEEIEQGDSTSEIIQKVFGANIKTIQDTLQVIHTDVIENAAEMMVHSNKVFFFGLGASASIALECYQIFIRSALRCGYIADYHMQLMSAALLQPGDCAFVISHTGTNIQTNEVEHTAHKAGANVIALTSYPDAPISDYADIVIPSSSSERKYRPESISVHMSQLSILDALFVLCQVMDEKKAAENLKKTKMSTESTRSTYKRKKEDEN
jgi:RpiR family carbohydrate utilization transcriptional regulator